MIAARPTIGRSRALLPLVRNSTSTAAGPEWPRNIEDDGYGSLHKESVWGNSYTKVAAKPGTLILVRHGESEWNQKKLFTGWVDVDLSQRGRAEIEHAARLLLERGYTIDIAYTSMLKRAIRSSWIILTEINQIYRPCVKSWRLNERMYGALEGVYKPGLAQVYGADTVQQWRAGLVDRPPPMDPTHPHWHGNEIKYKNSTAVIPNSESLQDCIDRTIPLWKSRILPDLKAGRNVLIVAHRNSIRGIVKFIDKIGTLEIQQVSIPNGIPLVYKFDREMNPIVHRKSVKPLSGIYLEKEGALRQALEQEDRLATHILGYDNAVNDASALPVEESTTFAGTALIDLIGASNATAPKATTTTKPGDSGASSIGEVAATSAATCSTAAPPSATSSTNDEDLHPYYRTPTPVTSSSGSVSVVAANSHSKQLSSLFKLGKVKELIELSKGEMASPISPPPEPATTDSQQCIKNVTIPYRDLASSTADGATTNANATVSILDKPLIVIIRHGKTEHNKLGLFTGWEDANLAKEGRTEALHAGRLLTEHGVNFDVVYTSWLSRAIETAWLVLNELDSLWVPIVKTWRLNERMYGALTGLSKKMIKQKYGETQFMRWRRGFDSPPPMISSFSHAYPGNDERYVTYVKDLPVSMVESMMRSMAHGKLELHRQFPKTESLKDCMLRTIPYFKDVIVPDSITPGKNVLIASSENAIRGLLMHLCDIPEERIHKVEIPTGLPLVYDSEKRKILLLEDHSLVDSPLKVYNFGEAPELLFKHLDTENNKDGK